MKHEDISLHTKQALAQALKNAMKTKPFKKITVSELIKECNLNRKTFYYHFEDIYALLKWTLEEAINVIKSCDLLEEHDSIIKYVMDYAEENDHVIQGAYESLGRDELKRIFDPDIREISISLINSAERKYNRRLEESYKSFLIRFYMEAMGGMFIEWIKERKNLNRDLVTHYFSDTILNSLNGIFNACE